MSYEKIAVERRILFLHKEMEHERFSLPDDVIRFVASSIEPHADRLRGALIRLKAYQSMKPGKVVSVGDARDILKDAIIAMDAKPIVERIQRIVATKYSLNIEDLKGQKRAASITLARKIAIYLACAITDMSQIDIGHIFGDMDHAMVLQARKEIEKMMAEDIFVLQLINRLQADIRTAEL